VTKLCSKKLKNKKKRPLFFLTFGGGIKLFLFVLEILKGVKVDLWVRNVQLGMFGIMGGIVVIYRKDADFIREHGFFGGYTWSTWLVIFINTIGGYLFILIFLSL
jgi:hypothetical protein